MQTVYVVSLAVRYEGMHVARVFSTKQKAIEFLIPFDVCFMWRGLSHDDFYKQALGTFINELVVDAD